MVTLDNTTGGTAGVLVKVASLAFPSTWVKEAHRLRNLEVKIGTAERGKHIRDVGVSIITLKPDSLHAYATAIHESAHWLQTALPDLDHFFAKLHYKRTTNGLLIDPLERLDQVLPGSGYKPYEMTRKDHYIDPFFGKESFGAPRELMPMSLQTLLGVDYATNADPVVRERALEKLQKLYNTDRELFNLTLGLLLRWKP
jgi:hypothetical protein